MHSQHDAQHDDSMISNYVTSIQQNILIISDGELSWQLRGTNLPELSHMTHNKSMIPSFGEAEGSTKFFPKHDLLAETEPEPSVGHYFLQLQVNKMLHPFTSLKGYPIWARKTQVNRFSYVFNLLGDIYKFTFIGVFQLWSTKNIA